MLDVVSSVLDRFENLNPATTAGLHALRHLKRSDWDMQDNPSPGAMHRVLDNIDDVRDSLADIRSAMAIALRARVERSYYDLLNGLIEKLMADRTDLTDVVEGKGHEWRWAPSFQALAAETCRVELAEFHLSRSLFRECSPNMTHYRRGIDDQYPAAVLDADAKAMAQDLCDILNPRVNGSLINGRL